jgi:hypothetical protein
MGHALLPSATQREERLGKWKEGAFGRGGETTTKKCGPLITLFSLLCKLLKSSVKFLFYAVYSLIENKYLKRTATVSNQCPIARVLCKL